MISKVKAVEKLSCFDFNSDYFLLNTMNLRKIVFSGSGISPKHHVRFGKTTTTKSFIMIMKTIIIMITELGKRRSVEDEEKKKKKK